MITRTINEIKNLDINIRGIKNISLKGVVGNELRIFGTEVSIDDQGKRSTDVDFKGSSETIKIEVPVEMYRDIELCCSGSKINLEGLRCEKIEIDSNDNLDISVRDHKGYIMLTQFKASSVMDIQGCAPFRAATRGKDNSILIEGASSDETANDLIELYGRSSTLKITAI